MHTTLLGVGPTMATMRWPRSILQRVHHASTSEPAPRGLRERGVIFIVFKLGGGPQCVRD